ncbi:MAG: AEC family transporter [Desulfobulbus sp.]|jgi:malonate transporter
MLFWKIGGAPLRLGQDWACLPAAALAVLTVCALSLLCIHLLPVGRFQAGSFNQGCYRFNTYIGMAVVINAFGAAGARLFGLLIGLLIPLINLLCVSVLIRYGGDATEKNRSAVLRALMTNPLIIGCCCGIGYALFVGRFPVPVDNTLRLLSQVTLPLALFSIGASLRLTALRAHLRLSLLAAGFKLVVLPVIGFIFLWLFGVSGPAHQVCMLFFALPTSTAIYILSGQLNSDTELASTVVVVSTVLSFVSMGLVLLGCG